MTNELRVQVAKIINSTAFEPYNDALWLRQREYALNKADKVIALAIAAFEAVGEPTRSDVAYQIVGSLAHYTGLFEHPEVQRALDYLGGKDVPDILPWPREKLTDKFDGGGTKSGTHVTVSDHNETISHNISNAWPGMNKPD